MTGRPSQEKLYEYLAAIDAVMKLELLDPFAPRVETTWLPHHEVHRVVQQLMKGEFDWLQGPLVQGLVPTPEAVEEAISKFAKSS